MDSYPYELSYNPVEDYDNQLEFLRRLYFDKSLRRSAVAFIYSVHKRFDINRKDSWPGDKKIKEYMSEYMGKNVSNNDFTKGRSEAFQAGLFVCYPEGSPNKTPLYYLLKFWEPSEHGKYRPIDHPYKGCQVHNLKRSIPAPKGLSAEEISEAFTEDLKEGKLKEEILTATKLYLTKGYFSTTDEALEYIISYLEQRFGRSRKKLGI